MNNHFAAAIADGCQPAGATCNLRLDGRICGVVASYCMHNERRCGHAVYVRTYAPPGCEDQHLTAPTCEEHAAAARSGFRPTQCGYCDDVSPVYVARIHALDAALV